LIIFSEKIITYLKSIILITKSNNKILRALGDSNSNNVVGIEILKKNGVNVDELIKQLVINSSVEFTAYYYFTLLRANCTGMDGEGIKGVIEDARLEDLSHFESCIERIYQLGGQLPKDAIDYIKMSGCEFLQLPDNPTDLKAILEKCLKAEQGAIVNWDKVCNMTHGKDPMTYDIAKDILSEEIEHESWFLELLYGRPSGHMRRKFSGERPHTRKHSRALDIS
jgi:ferritin-like protein